MSQYISLPFVVALSIALVWTTLFSLTTKPGVRGLRNLGILAAYILPLVFLFVAGWLSALMTWAVFGVAGGLLYILWEVLQRVRTPAGAEKPPVSPSHLVAGLLAWPIMVPEAIEDSLAELGILTTKTPGTTPDSSNAKTGTEGN
jgi:hypothetical protein